ncbi:MAG: VWA domain-containing protein, partial [Pirellulales bacterium]|nr:VWA domain-containing protein [Pirellulales bacterium]
MSRTHYKLLIFTLAVFAAVPLPIASSCLAVAAPPTAKPKVETSVFDAYTSDKGSYFAISLTPSAKLPRSGTAEVVVLMDTSASQVGPYREKAIESLQGLLTMMGDKDRVNLMAVDLNAVPMSNGFVAPNGPEMKAALEKLHRRVPLGSTDMEAALEAGHNAFQDQADQAATPRTVVYIGDGMSNANLTGSDAVGLINNFIKGHISISSFAVGPAINTVILAALANQTGGVVIVDGDRLEGADIGSQLAQASHGPVIWPTGRNLPETFGEVYPSKTPPLRLDRDAVLIGKGVVEGAFEVAIFGESAGKPVELNWKVAAKMADDENAYLALLVEAAKADGGYSLPTLGREGLLEAKRVLDENANALAQLSRQAAAAGDKHQAKRLADESLRRDPNNSNALILKGALDDEKVIPAQADISPPQSGIESTSAASADQSEGDLLKEFEQQQRVQAQKIMTEATVEMNHLRSRMPDDPAGVLNDLKILLDNLRNAPPLGSDERADLLDRVTVMIDQARQRRDAKEVADAEREKNLAAARDLMRLTDNLTRKDDRITGLVERFNSLMEQGYRDFDQLTNPSFRAAHDEAA